MKKNKRLCILLTLYFSIGQIDAQTPLSFEESLHLLNQGNQSLKIADKSIEIAKAERDKLNAFWYPSLQSTGAFVHMSEKIEVKQPLSQFTDPAKDFVHSIIPDDQIISSILDQIGANTLIFPLTPRNLTTVDLSAEWVLFSGGKRFRATNIGRTMVDLARESRAQVSANQQSLLVESYYGLRLAQQIVTVREETYNGLKKHYENALKLEAAGMIDKAGRLFAQVNMDEAKRALEAARKEETVVQSALKVLLNKKDADANIIPTSPLFMNDSLPPKMLFDLSVNSGNYTLNQLQLQQHIAKQEVRIAQSGYLPNIALFGKQTLYSHGIQSNLLPRTMVGIGFTWNLFDGLDREKRVRQSKLTEQTLALGQMKARDDLAVGVDKLYTQLEKAQDNVKKKGDKIMKILIVEDEPSLRELIQCSLEKERYVVETASDFNSALRKIEDYDYDCILLDIMLPDGSGLDLLERLKALHKRENVIIISAKDSLEDKVLGLELGADDYLPKPFHLVELNARIKSVIRRHQHDGEIDIRQGNVRIEPDKYRVFVNEQEVELNRKEYDILLYFINRPGRLINKNTLAESVWGDHIDQVDNFDFIYAQIKNLRKKLKDSGATIEIKAVYGFGYKMIVE
jgi:DNA-binding response OmpR family regulator